MSGICILFGILRRKNVISYKTANIRYYFKTIQKQERVCQISVWFSQRNISCITTCKCNGRLDLEEFQLCGCCLLVLNFNHQQTLLRLTKAYCTNWSIEYLNAFYRLVELTIRKSNSRNLTYMRQVILSEPHYRKNS